MAPAERAWRPARAKAGTQCKCRGYGNAATASRRTDKLGIRPCALRTGSRLCPNSGLVRCRIPRLNAGNLAAPQAASPLLIETSLRNSNNGNAGSPEGLAGHPIAITGWAAAFEIGTARAYDLGDF